ncbi:MAG TPA: LytR C-terminal domain-containing protein [Kineosporiaceae bacterium]|nr:LytR C-terminal domain-containing protein [Kineosporiaceae bacterium]
MSNSTRSGGYDERLVVPLEASRRGAHRARVNPLMSLLPVLAVVVVVAAVIGVAYTLFVRGSNGTDETATGTVPTTTAPANTNSAPANSPAAGGTTKPATSPSASTSATAAAVNKSASFTVYNGSTPPVNGLGAKAQAALVGDGWSKAKLIKGPAPVQLTSTRVYYAKASQQATAEAIAKSLGVGSAKLSSSIAASGIVVVVGNDYAG